MVVSQVTSSHGRRYSQHREEDAQPKAPEHGVLEERAIDPYDLRPHGSRSPLLDEHQSYNEAYGVHRSVDSEGLLQAECREHLVHDKSR